MSKISLDSKTEERLVNEAKKNKEAFTALYTHYYPYILNYIVNKVGNKEAAEDLTSSVFEKALNAIESFKWQGISFSSWLFRIAKNTVIDFYRASSKYKTQISLEYIDVPTTNKNPEELAIDEDFENRLKTLLNKLPERERKIIYMKFFEGYTNKTISGLVGVSETNVGTIVHRTVIKLRQSFL